MLAFCFCWSIKIVVGLSHGLSPCLFPCYSSRYMSSFKNWHLSSWCNFFFGWSTQNWSTHGHGKIDFLLFEWMYSGGLSESCTHADLRSNGPAWWFENSSTKRLQRWSINFVIDLHMYCNADGGWPLMLWRIGYKDEQNVSVAVIFQSVLISLSQLKTLKPFRS